MAPTQSHLSDEKRRFLISIVVAGFVSALLAFGLLLHLLYGVVRRRQGITPIKIFYLWLLFWDVIQGCSSMLNIQWVQRGQIVVGTVCMGQAIIKQLANTGTALSIMAMSCCILHDYVIESSGRHRPWGNRTGLIGIAIISLIQVIDIGLPNGLLHGSRQYYGISGYWCWISADHFTTKIVTEYLWFWLAWVFSFFTAVAFSFGVRNNKRLPAGFLWIGFPMAGGRLLRLGLFSIDKYDHNKGRLRWSFSLFEVTFHTRTVRIMLPIPIQYLSDVRLDANYMRLEQENTKQAFKLLLFPLAYLVLIAPISIVRFMGFRGHSVTFQTTITAGLVFSLSGFVDVVLFYWAKPTFGVTPVETSIRVEGLKFDATTLVPVGVTYSGPQGTQSVTSSKALVSNV
jgi:hypothetical protein